MSDEAAGGQGERGHSAQPSAGRGKCRQHREQIGRFNSPILFCPHKARHLRAALDNMVVAQMKYRQQAFHH